MIGGTAFVLVLFESIVGSVGWLGTILTQCAFAAPPAA